MEKIYKLLKTYESPTGRIHIGVRKTELEWQEIFTGLYKGDCDIKKDWFEFIDIAPDNYEDAYVKIPLDRFKELWITEREYYNLKNNQTTHIKETEIKIDYCPRRTTSIVKCEYIKDKCMLCDPLMAK